MSSPVRSAGRQRRRFLSWMCAVACWNCSAGCLAGPRMGDRVEAGIHPTAAVLALAAAAVVAGMKGYTAITGWIPDVSAAVLADRTRGAGAHRRAAVGDDDLAGAHRRRPGGV